MELAHQVDAEPLVRRDAFDGALVGLERFVERLDILQHHSEVHQYPCIGRTHFGGTAQRNYGGLWSAHAPQANPEVIPSVSVVGTPGHYVAVGGLGRPTVPELLEHAAEVVVGGHQIGIERDGAVISVARLVKTALPAQCVANPEQGWREFGPYPEHRAILSFSRRVALEALEGDRVGEANLEVARCSLERPCEGGLGITRPSERLENSPEAGAGRSETRVEPLSALQHRDRAATIPGLEGSAASSAQHAWVVGETRRRASGIAAAASR